MHNYRALTYEFSELNEAFEQAAVASFPPPVKKIPENTPKISKIIKITETR